MKYKINQILLVRFKFFKPDQDVLATVTATQQIQTKHMRPECYLTSYLCSPLELEGFEHDKQEWIPEANIESIPYIKGRQV